MFRSPAFQHAVGSRSPETRQTNRSGRWHSLCSSPARTKTRALNCLLIPAISGFHIVAAEYFGFVRPTVERPVLIVKIVWRRADPFPKALELLLQDQAAPRSALYRHAASLRDPAPDIFEYFVELLMVRASGGTQIRKRTRTPAEEDEDESAEEVEDEDRDKEEDDDDAGSDEGEGPFLSGSA